MQAKAYPRSRYRITIDSFEGRFAGLLPPKPVDEKTRQMGKVLLEAMGVKVGKLKA